MDYWREGNEEVDFVVSAGDQIFALEVKSSFVQKTSGLTVFRKKYPDAHTLLIGSDGIPLEDFFLSDPRSWFE